MLDASDCNSMIMRGSYIDVHAQGQELFMRVESLNGTIRNALEALPGIASQLDPLVEQVCQVQGNLWQYSLKGACQYSGTACV
jgi:hypothetical protein